MMANAQTEMNPSALRKGEGARPGDLTGLPDEEILDQFLGPVALDRA